MISVHMDALPLRIPGQPYSGLYLGDREVSPGCLIYTSI